MFLLQIFRHYKLPIIMIGTLIFIPISASYAQSCSTNIDLGKNIVCNGDFEQGDYCFTTDYVPFSQSPVPYSSPGYYFLGSDGTFFNSAFSASNHTIGGNKFLMVDGSCTPNLVVWKQTVNILPNTNYFFSAWLCALYAIAPAQLQFSINGIVIGSPFNAPGTNNVWTQFTQLWNSGSLSGPIVIEIINLTTAGCNNGNDFGIDDISFIPGCKFGTPGPQPNIGPDIYLCPGSPGILLNSGLNPPYTNYNIYWSTGEKTPAITVTAPGKYSVCVDSAGSCTRSDVIEVIPGNQIKASFVAFPLSGCSPLVVWAKSQTKGAPLTFQWYIDGVLTPYTTDSLPRQTLTATGAVPMIHTIKLVATNNCGNSDDTTVQVTVFPPPQINAGPDTSVCNGENVQLNAYGGGIYSWTPSTGLSCITCPNPIANPGYTITYSVNVINTNGCTATDNVTYTALYNLNLKMSDTSLCAGENVTLNTGITDATSYNWSPSTGLSCTTCANPIATPSSTTTYNVNVSKGNCSGNGSITVTIKNCAPTVTASDVTICSGTCGIVTSSATGGLPPYAFLWNTGAVTANISLCPVTTTSYTVTITDSNGATATDVSVVTVNPLPTITATTASVCNGTCAIITASGAGTGTYTWSSSLGNGSSQNVCPTTTTTYSLTGTDTNGCTNTATTTVIVNPTPVINIPDASICPGGTTTLTATGALTYTWLPATGLNSTTGTTVTANPTVTTTYTVCGISSDGCSSCATVKVAVGALVATAGQNVTICSNACTNLTAGGGTIYSWSPAIGLSNPNIFNPVACPTATTTYTVNVSDGSCSDDAIVVVTVNPPVTLNVAPVNVTCFGACNGQTIAIPSGGNGSYTYNWSGGCTQAACSNVCAGTYTLTATDGSGCTATGSTTVTEPSVLTIANTFTNVSCFGACDGTASVTAGGGTPPYNYAWLPSGGTSANATALCAGSYTCTVTDVNNCFMNFFVTITQPAKVIVTSASVNLCPNECTTLNSNCSGGVAPYNYSWAPGGLTTTSVSVCPATTTTYSIIATDVNGCKGNTSITVSVNPTPVISAPSVTICEKTSVTLNASGATIYTWSPSNGLNDTTIHNPVANPIITATYTVIGKSSFGCTSSTTVIVTVNPAPIISSSPASVCPDEDTILTASGAILYSWIPSASLSSNVGISVVARPISTTTYTITGIGTNGCASSTSVIVTVHPKPKASFTTSPDIADEFNPTIYFYDNSTGGIMTKWNWNFGDFANTISLLQNPEFTYPPISNKYSVKLIVANQFGCIDTINGNVYVHGIFTFYIPNTFTPNGDGKNDGFMPRGVGIDESDYYLWIFDRWGNLIWQTSIWGEAWDGKVSQGAEIVQIDSYVWKVHVREKESGAKHNYIGHVNIVK